MLRGLDDVGWTRLTHAYGSAGDVPDLLRQAAGTAEVGEALDEMYGCLFHQGTVYPATAAAVPFLVELARRAPTRRDEFVWLLGMLADPRHAYGTAFDEVRASVIAYADVLTPLLADADPQVRTAAAYALAQCAAPPAPFRARWAAEEDPAVRASLAFALGLADPGASAEPLADAVLHAPPPVRVAAALALVRNGVAWPDGAVPAVVDVIEEAEVEVEYAWQRDADWTDELLTGTDDDLAAALLRRMCAAPSADVRRAAVWGMTVRGQARRGAPAVLLPMVRPLLDDPDDGVRAEVVGAFRRSGAAAGAFAGELRAVAERYPETAHQVAITPESKAVETLMLLGDPGWVDPVCAAGGHDPLPRRGASWSERSFAAVRRRLGALGEHPATPLLAAVLGQWGPRAAGAVPELLSALPYAGEAVSRALLRIGHLTPETAPYLRTLAERDGDLAAADGVWRLTGDPRWLLGVLDGLLTRDGARPAAARVLEPGPALEPLVPAARRHLTGTAADTYPRRDVQILAAGVLYAATGDPAPALPTVRAVLAAGGRSASRAAELVADLPPAAVADLVPALSDLLADRWCTVAAARALWRLGTPPSTLAEPLVAAVTAPYGGGGAVPLLVEMHAVDAAADLDRLAGREERIVVAGIDDDIVWEDERLRDELRTAVAALRRPAVTR